MCDRWHVLLDAGLSVHDIARLFNGYDEGRLRAAIAYTEKRVKNSKLSRVDNVPAYFRGALDKKLRAAANRVVSADSFTRKEGSDDN